MNQDNIRQRLIDGTIRVIAKDGLDKASTKQIGIVASVNEAYIYRCFEDKEDMLAKTFSSLDDELVAKTMQHIPVMYMQEMEYELRCRVFFSFIWKFSLGNSEKCLAYIRYYYSPYFIKYSADEHRKKYLSIAEKFKDAFNSKANVWIILNHILTTMLDFAVRVFDGELSNNEDTEEHVFRLIYVSVQQYFKTRES